MFLQEIEAQAPVDNSHLAGVVVILDYVSHTEYGVIQAVNGELAMIIKANGKRAFVTANKLNVMQMHLIS